MTAKMERLCQDRENAIAILNTLDAKNDFEQYKAKLDEIKQIDNAIDLLEQSEALNKEKVKEVVNSTEDNKKFKNFAEQLRAIKDAATSRGSKVDPRLVSNEIKGVNTLTDADGGYAIQSDFIGNILDRAFERSEIVNRCTTYSISANSNRVNFVTLDDANDAADSSDGKVIVAGGVQAYWTGEGQTVPPTKPKFKATELKLGKIMGIAYATEESLEDMPFLSQLLEDSFADAVSGLLTEGILNGDGSDTSNVRKPLGILNSDALVTVTPKSATALSAKDFLAMKSALRKKNWANAVWFMHPDLEAELPLLADDNGNLLYMPEGGISGAQYATILGRPVVFDEFLAARGEKGSILLADMSEYMLVKKGVERHDWSMHVEFLTDQQCFRIITRVNGAPMYNNTWAVRNSKTKRGAFVTLAKYSD